MCSLSRLFGPHALSCLPILSMKACTLDLLVSENQSPSDLIRVREIKEKRSELAVSRIVAENRYQRRTKKASKWFRLSNFHWGFLCLLFYSFAYRFLYKRGGSVRSRGWWVTFPAPPPPRFVTLPKFFDRRTRTRNNVSIRASNDCYLRRRWAYQPNVCEVWRQTHWCLPLVETSS